MDHERVSFDLSFPLIMGALSQETILCKTSVPLICRYLKGWIELPTLSGNLGIFTGFTLLIYIYIYIIYHCKKEKDFYTSSLRK